MRTHVRVKRKVCVFLTAGMFLLVGCYPPSLDEVCTHVSECIDWMEHGQCLEWFGPQVLSDDCYEALATVDCDEFDNELPMPTSYETAYNQVCWPDCNGEYSIECFGEFLIACSRHSGSWEVTDCYRQCQIWEHDYGTCAEATSNGTRCDCEDD